MISKIKIFSCIVCLAGLVGCGTRGSIEQANIIKPADIEVSADVTNEADQQGEIRDLWQVANRIAPRNGVAVRPGLKVNTVRMLGGILTKGKGKKVPDLAYDLVSYDEAKGDYIYDFKPLINRINKILKGGTPIYQIVVDQPAWAFQRGYAFIPNDQQDGIHFREKERVSIYGNSLPPYDKAEYVEFMQACIRTLIEVYGVETVKSWRFRIGSEIETPEHWYGTEKEFVEYFANTATAIRSVLPEAIVGLHTREPHFVYRNGTIKNYKGEVIKAFAYAVLEHAFENQIRIDFWGISDYPIITTEHTRDPKVKFEELFLPLTSHPKWQAGTVIDIEEFSIVSAISGRFLIPSDTAQADTLKVAMTNELMQHGISQIFQWGQREPEHEEWTTKSYKTMAGKTRIANQKVSLTDKNIDDVEAIIAVESASQNIDVLVYNYNPNDIEATDIKEIRTNITTPTPAGTVFYYRTRVQSKDNYKFQSFMAQPGAEQYLGKEKVFNRYGNSGQVFNDEGKAAYKAYAFNNPSKWSEWKQARTHSLINNASGSAVKVNIQLPLFSFGKIEIKWQH